MAAPNAVFEGTTAIQTTQSDIRFSRAEPSNMGDHIVVAPTRRKMSKHRCRAATLLDCYRFSLSCKKDKGADRKGFSLCRNSGSWTGWLLDSQVKKKASRATSSIQLP